MEIRSFLAFELPPEIKSIVSHASQDMSRFPIDVRWVKVNNIHLTMVFMGNIHPENLKGIGENVERVCHRYGPFDISLKGAGVFANRRNPRVLWVGLKGALERMSHFKGALHKHLRPFGVKVEKRSFRPHLTLGRFPKGARPGPALDELLTKYEDLGSPVCSLGQLVMFRSDLKPGGAEYTNLKAWPLEGRH
ncbi:MAG: RNA 2',3'-cyclic phosphodiesterase [Deltaproteobacteria bacterium]|nr:RNA 2',3'-cyclic phosphodiesterase [Deltaproteobacteria bacterium]